jgi:spermidine synthase
VIPWKHLDRSKIPGHDDEVTLLQRGEEFSIRTAGTELMNSRVHGSEDELAELACQRIKQKPDQRILIGGLGMGYTLAAALLQSDPDTRITVCELIPAVIQWNKKYLGHLAQMPLEDSRVFIETKDVAKAIQDKKSVWDAILLDVDNGPEGLTRKANDRLYNISGLKQSFAALCPGGILAVWSSSPSDGFSRRLKQCGFQIQIITVRARKSGKGSKHTIWLAAKP